MGICLLHYLVILGKKVQDKKLKLHYRKFYQRRRNKIMPKLNIKIKVSEIEELAPVIEKVKNLELGKVAECNPEVTIELEV